MDFAFPALLIFVLIMPGLFFVNAYYKVDSQDIKFVALSQKTALALLAALILHYLFFLILLFLGSSIESIKFIQYLFNPNFKDFSLTRLDILYAPLYIIVLSISGFIFGAGVRFFISKYKIDKFIKQLRVRNKWIYFFKGYDFTVQEPELVELFALVEAGGQSYLYRGFLQDFYIDDKGNLDVLILSDVSRTLTGGLGKELSPDSNEKMINISSSFHPIKGDYMILKYSEIVNFNVFFIQLSELKNSYINTSTPTE